MDETIRKIRHLLGHKRYEEIEEPWLELLAGDVPFSQLDELADLLVRYAPKSTSALLLSLLAESLKGRGMIGEQLGVLRRQAELVPEDAVLARELVEALRKTHVDVLDLDQYLQKSGLGYGQPLKESLPRFDRYIALSPGSSVFEPDRGPGLVKKLDLLLDKVTVDFDSGAELSWDVAVAARRLRVAARDGFFARLRRDRQGLVKLAVQEPSEVVAMYLRDIGRAASVRELQDGLAGVVRSEGWDGFWNRARRELARHPHVVVRTSPGRVYVWVDEAVEVETPADPDRKMRNEFDAGEVSEMSPDEIETAYLRLTSFAERKNLLGQLPEARPDDWEKLYARLFSQGKDSRARALMERALSSERPEFWQSFLNGLLTGYRQNADGFLWLIEHAGRLGVATPRAIASRVFDLLESDGHRPYWVKLRHLVVADDYRLVREAFAEMDEAEAGRLVARVGRARTLEGYRADEIVQLAGEKFPSLAEKVHEDVIYTTRHGIDKAREELRRLTVEEIPKSAEEIARARAHGDLSENYEYKAAKEKQARLMQKTTRLRDEIARARTITAADIDTDEVSIGSRVRLEDGAGTVHVYAILGPWDTDPDNGIISYQSPFAGLLLGKKIGESVEIDGRPFAIAGLEPGLPA